MHRIDTLIIIILGFLLIFEDFVVEGVNKCEKFGRLLILKEDSNRLESEEPRQYLPHVLEKFAKSSLCTGHGGKLNRSYNFSLNSLQL